MEVHVQVAAMPRVVMVAIAVLVLLHCEPLCNWICNTFLDLRDLMMCRLNWIGEYLSVYLFCFAIDSFNKFPHDWVWWRHQFWTLQLTCIVWRTRCNARKYIWLGVSLDTVTDTLFADLMHMYDYQHEMVGHAQWDPYQVHGELVGI